MLDTGLSATKIGFIDFYSTIKNAPQRTAQLLNIEQLVTFVTSPNLMPY